MATERNLRVGRVPRWAMGMALASVAALVVACGSDATEESSTAGLTGTPYKIFSINDDTPAHPMAEVIAAGEESVKYVNQHGGVNGHPVQIEFCNGQLDPNATASCANKAISDPAVIATAGNYMVAGSGATRSFGDAGLAQLGMFPVGGPDYSCPVCFNTGGGNIVSVAAEATVLTDVKKAKRLGFVGVDTPAARVLPDLLGKIMASSGRDATIVKPLFSPYGAADFNGVIASLQAEHLDGVILAIPLNMLVSFIRAASSLGMQTPLGVNLSQNLLPELQDLGSATQNIYVTTFYRHDLPAFKTFSDTMKKNRSDTPATSDAAVGMWDSVTLFTQLAKSVPSVDRQSITQAASKLTRYDSGLMAQPVDFTATFTGLGGTYPRIPNPNVYYAHLDGDTNVVHDLGGAPVNVFVKPGA